MEPRDLLTAEDIRSAGFRPEPPSETTDEQAAHVWYSSARRGDRWHIGLGLYAATHVADADRYWAGVLADLDRGDGAPEPVAVGDQAVHADGWLYLRQNGHVVWVAVEGPDPVLARWAVERLARAVCPRVQPLRVAAPAPAGPAVPTGVAESEPGLVVRPRPAVRGRYRRRHLANARLGVAADALVVTDVQGRDHRLPLDGTPAAPAAIGVARTPRTGLAYLAVVDRTGRLVARDGEVAAWAPDDLRAVAASAGLDYLGPDAPPARVDRHRPPIEVEGTPWTFLTLALAAVVAMVVLAVAGAPVAVLVAVPTATVVVGAVAARLARTRVTPPARPADEPVTW